MKTISLHLLLIIKSFKIITFTLIITTLLNCSTQNNSLIKFDLTNLQKTQKVSLSQLNVTDIQYIPLETDSSSLLTEIKSVKKDSHAFIVLDYKRLTSFSPTGIYNAQIGKRGRGPKEYNFPNDFSTNDSNNNVYVLSDYEDKIYVYKSNGTFLKTIKCPNQTTDILCVNDLILCYSGNRNGTVKNSFDLIDNDGNKIKSFPNKFNYKARKTFTTFSSECLFYLYSNIAYAKEVCSDTVFQFKEMSFIPAFIFNQGDKSFPVSAREESEWGPEIMKKYITQRNLFRVNNSIYYEFTNNGNHFGFWGSLKEDSQVLINLNNGIVNDIDGGVNLWFKLSAGKNTIISWINAQKLKAHVATEAFKNSTPKYPEKKKELEKLANSLDESDNPVLMLVKLKE